MGDAIDDLVRQVNALSRNKKDKQLFNRVENAFDRVKLMFLPSNVVYVVKPSEFLEGIVLELKKLYPGITFMDIMVDKIPENANVLFVGRVETRMGVQFKTNDKYKTLFTKLTQSGKSYNVTILMIEITNTPSNKVSTYEGIPVIR